jgi:quercetin dioxygenase-like cupin family protein
MLEAKSQPRYGLNPYNDWTAREGLPIAEAVALDLFSVPLGDWPRYGARGAIAHFTGRGDYCNMFVLELAPGTSTLPQQHLYEEVFFVLEGRGSTQLELRDGAKRSFEWGPHSFFAIPLNAKHRHFNGSGSQRALLASTTNLPQIINIFHDEHFIFNSTYAFDGRRGKDEYYAGEGDLHLIRQGNNIWETNFVPDMLALTLTPYEDRGPGSSNIKFILADGIMHAHMSEIAPATYKKGHRHRGGTHVMTISGRGYSLLWSEGEGDFTRVDWKYGTVFPPLEGQFHQHFVTTNESSRYIATNIGSIRYPLTEVNRRTLIGDGSKRQGSSLSIKLGGNQIEYEDQDPRIHEIWLEEMRKNSVTPRFSAPGKLLA